MSRLRRRVIKPGGMHESILQRDLSRADRMADRAEYEQAIDLLIDLNERYPGRIDILRKIAGLAVSIEDPVIFEDSAELLTEIQPDDPDNWADLFTARMLNQRPCLALQAFYHLQARWPNHETVHERKEKLPDLEEVTEEMMKA